MLKRVITLSLISFLLLPSFVNKKSKTRAVFKSIDKNVNTRSTAYNSLKQATENIGHRLTGSANGQKAEEMAYNMLKGLDLKEVSYQSFEVNSWSRGKLDLAIVPANSDNYRDIDAVSLGHSPKASNVVAHIVDCGDGLESDFEEVGENLKGNIALFNVDVRNEENKGKKNLHRSEKTALAIKNGASAVILVNRVKGNVLLTGTASVTGELIDIPAVCVSYESGRAIRKWIRDEKNIMAEIDMLNFFKPVKARNVKATYDRKSKLSNEKIVVGAHLDSWDLAQGAVDNGLGAFTVLDIARVFSELKLKTKRPIEFVLFMGEEQGLLGSKEYVKKAKENGEIDRISLMVNLDMLNNCHGFNAFGNESLKKEIDEVGTEIQSIFDNYPNQNSNKAGLHSDHEFFMLSGIPVCLPSGKLSKEALDCYHADCDEFALINQQELENNVKYTSMMLYALANADHLPAALNSSETRDFLVAQNLKEELVLGKKWNWD
ncbi:M28 family peptidase [Jiulongibacter sp. NS-SX5]|uniref:M28 family peptidase n=1 Tax=Jiulongibacter sp. NS-SX5 TaxID=3463854 RepID=UPI0040585338